MPELDHTPIIGCNLSGGKGEELFVERDSYFGNAHGSMERNGWGQCIQNNPEPYYHHKEGNSLQGKYHLAMLNEPEKKSPLYVTSIFCQPLGVGWG